MTTLSANEKINRKDLTCTTVVQPKGMTTQELAKVLGVSDRTIRNTVENLGRDFRKNISKSSKGGRPSMIFTETQATAIKLALQNHSKVNELSPKSMTEKMLLIEQAVLYSKEIIEQLQSENENLKIELDEAKDWYSVKRMEKLNPDKKFDWRLLKQESAKLGIETKKVFDQNYGEVNAYHKDVWESLYFDTLDFE